ncbi:VOC family protein [Vibrio sonorensis]|uniref:VOC family protein n=1 Tax=Vibrio sonorensis TaxID=1004316 RepID=UPI0008D98082|nr:VOC family protein [Vibrio sonorensis]
MPKSLKNTGLAPNEMLVKLDQFMDKIHGLMDILGLNMQPYKADHIALRINDNELAQLAHKAWLELGEEISCAKINGRPIIVVKLHREIEIGSWKVDCIELPYPAVGKTYPQQGWEHIEFVVPSKTTSISDYQQELFDLWPELERNWARLAALGVKTKLSSPKGEGERLSNPTLAFKYDGVCIKLHPHTLESIVQSEQEGNGLG